MENFIVSARKYRPSLFDQVVGQTHITTTLKNAIKNHPPSTCLFVLWAQGGRQNNLRQDFSKSY